MSLAHATGTDTMPDQEQPRSVDEPPDARRRCPQGSPMFCKSPVFLDRKESLLTKALLSSPEPDTTTPDILLVRPRRRSFTSNASMASTAELTSDGGLTSPARSNTPSPPLPSATYAQIPSLEPQEKVSTPLANPGHATGIFGGCFDGLGITANHEGPAEVAPRKRCITFACGATKEATGKPADAVASPSVQEAAPRRPCMVKFACTAKPVVKPTTIDTTRLSSAPSIVYAPLPKSPASVKRLRLHPTSPMRARHASISPIKRSTITLRGRPRFVSADEEALKSAKASQFHEFARDEVPEDDWIRESEQGDRAKLTINDTLKVENAIRQLGDEAEEEAKDEADDEAADLETISEDEDEDETMVGFYVDDRSDHDVSDGNESDNEAGFADSDDGDDSDGRYEFWSLGNRLTDGESGQRPSATRRESISSIDSTSNGTINFHGCPLSSIAIRAATPDLPDSTDFVCGTLDEDRPLEEAYASCVEARKQAKRGLVPQDIDPSFPESDLEEEEEEDAIDTRKEDHDSIAVLDQLVDHQIHSRRSPLASPKRLLSPPATIKRCRSPPPPKLRLRSPPPQRKLFGQSPKQLRGSGSVISDASPAPSEIACMEGSQYAGFVPLGARPGLTHTKSLPRGAAFLSRFARCPKVATRSALTETFSHNRGAIDIVKGLEHKRQYREKLYRSRRCQAKRKPQPGQGAERMKELGLLMAGKTNAQTSYMLSL